MAPVCNAREPFEANARSETAYAGFRSVSPERISRPLGSKRGGRRVDCRRGGVVALLENPGEEAERIPDDYGSSRHV
jgi:hypothetical protein